MIRDSTLSSLMGDPPQHSPRGGRCAPDAETSHRSLQVANGMCVMFHPETGKIIPQGNPQGWMGNTPSSRLPLHTLDTSPKARLQLAKPAPSPPRSYLNTPVIKKSLPPSSLSVSPSFSHTLFSDAKGSGLLLWQLQHFSYSEHCQYEILRLRSNLCGSVK